MAGRGQMCSGGVAKRTLLAIISLRSPTEGAALTTRWSPHQASRSSGRQDSRVSSLGRLVSDEQPQYLRTIKTSPLTSAISLDLLDAVKGANVSTLICYSTKRLYHKDPANFLFPWPRGDAERQQGSLCQIRCYESEASIRALQHASATHSFAGRSQRWH